MLWYVLSRKDLLIFNLPLCNLHFSFLTGLVISKLAEQSANSGKATTKDGLGFVPYRDSVLTWLLKDSLGGNSRTIMLATLSPAEDNFEETLSTLRYADRAKRITNHAVVNEDPNARLIRELKAEVERLKNMLSKNQTANIGPGGQLLSTSISPDKASAKLAEEMATTEQLMEAMSLTRDQKLALTEERRQNQGVSSKAPNLLIKNGAEVGGSGYFLVNLNADPSLSGLLVYSLKSVTRVGSSTNSKQDIRLEGVGIREEHCVLTVVEDEDCLWMEPLMDAQTCVNGRPVTVKTALKHGDRLLLGANHFFRVQNSKEEGKDDQLMDWTAAQEEILREQAGQGHGLDVMMAKLEERYEAEKKAALERQRTEYEKQMRRMEHQKDGTEDMASFQREEDENDEASGNVLSWLEESANTDKMDKFKKSLGVLRQSLVRANMMTREANQMSEELERATKFSVSLQIPPEHLSPNSRSGAFMTQPSILVLRQGEGRQVWPLEKMESRLIAMRELNSMVKDKRVALSEIGDPIPDPFYEAVESHSLVGVANFYLSTLFHGVAFEYYAPNRSQNGTVAGKLLVEIQKLAGAFPADRVGHCNEDKDSEATTASVEDVSNGHSSSSNSSGKNNNGASNSITVGIKIKAIVGLPPALAHFVFCEYRFWGESEYTVVPTALEPRGGGRARKAADTVDFKFDHCRTVQVC
jgi:kinesin family protein 13